MVQFNVIPKACRLLYLSCFSSEKNMKAAVPYDLAGPDNDQYLTELWEEEKN